MRCCEACFEDPVLKDYIRRHGTRGPCQYCRARRWFVVEAAELEHLFTRFTEIYSPINLGENVPPDADVLAAGEQLATLIHDQWGIFSDRLITSERHHDLLHEIFTANCVEEEILDAPAVRDLWTDHNWLHSTLLDRWHELADELEHPERARPLPLDFQPTEDDLAILADPLDWFGEDVDRAAGILPAGSPIFRVRLGYREQGYRVVPIPVAEMGAPPVAAVTNPGRANPVAVSYFNGAQEEQTAVAEVRPHRGALATIGAGEVLRELRVLNLAAGIGITSPFACSGEFFRGLMESCELFNHLNEQFAKPLRHTDDVHEYRPTQFFAQWASDHHYDGLQYGSAMTPGGHNVVLFDPATVAVRSVRLVYTDAVQVTYRDYLGEE